MLRRFAFLFAFLLMARPLLSANVRVTDVTVQTHWPWNGLVDIIYSIESDNPCQLHQMTFHCHDRMLDRTVEMKSLSGTGVNFLVNAGGPYKVTWDAGKDAPEFRSASFVVDVMASVVDEPPYLMIDLSEGPAASSYPVKYTMQPPDASGDDCRTTELWLRHIPRGTFTMGSPGNSKVVTLTEDYYIGVFECTQRQYELVTGGNPSIYNEQGATRPVEMVTYNDLRGADTGSGWPGKGHDVDAGSFFGLLQAKTGLLLDLPTSAQWEYSCRAGTTTDLNSGENITNATPCPNLARLARYDATRHDGKPFHEHTRVGSYLPNAWGLYDCHGNVWEWCLDWSSEATSEAVSDPVGPSTGAFRVQRGGCWGDPYWKEAGWCTSSVQSDNYEDTAWIVLI